MQIQSRRVWTEVISTRVGGQKKKNEHRRINVRRVWKSGSESNLTNPFSFFPHVLRRNLISGTSITVPNLEARRTAAERVTNDGVVTVHFTRGLAGRRRHRLRIYVHTISVVSTLFVCEKRLNRYRVIAIFFAGYRRGRLRSARRRVSSEWRVGGRPSTQKYTLRSSDAH